MTASHTSSQAKLLAQLQESQEDQAARQAAWDNEKKNLEALFLSKEEVLKSQLERALAAATDGQSQAEAMAASIETKAQERIAGLEAKVKELEEQLVKGQGVELKDVPRLIVTCSEGTNNELGGSKY